MGYLMDEPCGEAWAKRKIGLTMWTQTIGTPVSHRLETSSP